MIDEESIALFGAKSDLEERNPLAHHLRGQNEPQSFPLLMDVNILFQGVLVRSPDFA